MAWDDNKDSGDLIKSSDWETMVNDQKGRINGVNITDAKADTSGNLSAGTSGRILFETDTGRVLYDNGSSLVELGLSESEISLDNLGSKEADNLAGNNGTSGQVLQSDGSNAQWADLESETVNTISSDYTTSGETTILVNGAFETFNPGFNAFCFADSGTRIYQVDNGNADIIQYDLSTAYDITSVSKVRRAFLGFSASDLAFKPDGTAFLATRNDPGNNFWRIDYTPLNTAWDVSDQDSNNGYDASGEFNDLRGFDWNNDGTKLFVTGKDKNDTPVIQSYLTSAYKAPGSTVNAIDISVHTSNPSDLEVLDNGNAILVSDGSNIERYNLSSAYDLTTASYDSTFYSFSSGNIRNFDLTDLTTNDLAILSGSLYQLESINVTLSSSNVSNGKIIRVVDTTENAVSVTIDTEGSELINGESSAVLNSNYEGLTFQSDGTNWFIVSTMDGGSV